MRDLILDRTPYVLSESVYGTAALAGALTTALFQRIGPAAERPHSAWNRRAPSPDRIAAAAACTRPTADSIPDASAFPAFAPIEANAPTSEAATETQDCTAPATAETARFIPP